MRHAFNLQYLLKKFDQDVEVIKRSIIKTTILNSRSQKPDLLLGPLPITPFQDHAITLNISFSNIQLTKSNDELIIVKVHSYDPETRNSLILKKNPIGSDNHSEHMTIKIPVFSISKLVYLTFNSNLGRESIYHINYVKLDCPYPISKASQYSMDLPYEEQLYIEINTEKIIETKSENLNSLIENINNFGYMALIFYFLPNYEQNIQILTKYSNQELNNKPKSAFNVTQLINKIKKEHDKYQELDRDLVNLKMEKELLINQLDDKTTNRNKLVLYERFKNKLEERKNQIEKFQQIKIDSRDEERINFILQGYRQKLSLELDKLIEYKEKLVSKKVPENQTNSETLDKTLVKIRTYEKVMKDTQRNVHDALIQLFYYLIDL